MHKKFLLILTAVVIFVSSPSNAAKIDVYRDAILNKSYTIKYEISKMPIYQSNHDSTFNDKGLSKKSRAMRLNLRGSDMVQNGVVVADGNDMYIENAFDTIILKHNINNQTITTKIPAIGICNLVKDNKFFNFYYETKNDKKNYFGSYGMFGIKNLNVKEEDQKALTPYQNLMQDYSLGNTVLNNIFSPIIPPERLIATPTSSIYQFVSSGTAKDGLSYEDFASNKENIFSAVRYYFDGDNLVKVAHVSYLKDGNKLQAYEKFIVDITEFSTTPDRKYLSLPAELKVKKK